MEHNPAHVILASLKKFAVVVDEEAKSKIYATLTALSNDLEEGEFEPSDDTEELYDSFEAYVYNDEDEEESDDEDDEDEDDDIIWDDEDEDDDDSDDEEVDAELLDEDKNDT